MIKFIYIILIVLMGVSIGKTQEEYYPVDYKANIKMEKVTYRILFPCPKSKRTKRRIKIFKEFMDNFSGSVFAMNKKDEIILLNKLQEKELREKQRCIVDLLTLED